ncbi:MAG TPA: phospholipase D-like domain-containing protein [Thermoanaerobaculia bacterium]|nr:phospholipase D-like domain-containing protein [Thermoanaerobaculia bacterium]
MPHAPGPRAFASRRVLRRLRRLRPMLRPGVDHRLPPELTARRIGRLAAALPTGVRGPGLETLLRRVETKPVHPGNQLELYHTGEAAFAAMFQAVAAARQEVLLESYIFKDDAVGRGMLDELAAAARRGVAVRVLADALGSLATRADFWRDMARRGVDAHLFNPLFKHLWYQPFRDHRKLLVVDRNVGFTGGMNIGVEYGSPSAPGGPWRDTHVRVTGPAAWTMAIVFNEGWEYAGGEPIDLPPLTVAPDLPGARVLVLDARPLRGNREAAASLVAIAAAARERLWITNAYFAPGHTAVRTLAGAARRGVDVRLLLPGRSDVPIVRHAGHGYFGDLLRLGVRIFEYGAAVLHAKSLVADGYLSVVGSTNLDFRSFLFNAECNLVVFDAPFAARLEESFAGDLANAAEITLPAWRRRPLLHRAGDRLARMLSPIL